MTDIQKTWQACIAQLAQELPALQLSTWIKPLVCEQDDDGRVAIYAPARKVLQFVESKLWKKIQTAFCALAEIAPEDIQLKLRLGHAVAESMLPMTPKGVMGRHADMTPLTIFGEGDINAGAGSTDESTFLQQPVAPSRLTVAITPTHKGAGFKSSTGLQPNHTFDRFVTGKSNQLAFAAAQQIAEKPGVSYNPFFLYGGVGLGKTHLVQAIGNSLSAQHGLRVRYIHADDYFGEVAKAMRHNSYESFKQEFRALDVLIIDDVHFLQNRTRTQEELFFLFNALMENSRQVIVTSDRYPRDIENLQERLRSRFEWGLTVAIEPPEIELRVAILQQKARVEHIDLDTASSYYIAKHLKVNVRELEGALNKVLAYTRFHGMAVTAESVRLALKDVIGHVAKPLTIENIQKTVADYLKIRMTEMFSKSRTRDAVRARQMAMWLARDLTTMSLPSIGEAFGGRDHTTVLHACRTVEDLRQKTPKFNQDLRILEQMLKGE